jgi:hypothetical protein
MSKTYQEQFQKNKAKYPSVYQPRTEADDQLLSTSYKDGITVQEISKKLQRQPYEYNGAVNGLFGRLLPRHGFNGYRRQEESNWLR